jgi:hypothetical protein
MYVWISEGLGRQFSSVGRIWDLGSRRVRSGELGSISTDIDLPPLKVPTQGRFYAIQYGKGGLLTTAEKAYKTTSNAKRLKRAQEINKEPHNRKYWRKPGNDFERKNFPDGIIDFNPNFTCDKDQRRVKKEEKRCFASIWIPLCEELAARAFFAEYELRFNPSEIFGIPTNPRMSDTQKENRIADITTMVPFLEDGLKRRAGEALMRRTLAARTVPSTLTPVARRLSTAQIDLFREFFPDNAGGINFESFQFSFELFANGELGDEDVGLGFGEPDSAFYFLFAEFAFLCIDSDIDKAVWTKALRPFVKTQEIFMHIYRRSPHVKPPPVGAPLPKPRATPRPLSDFSFGNFNPVGRSDEPRKKELREKYDKMGVNSLRRAASENLWRAQHML